MTEKIHIIGASFAGMACAEKLAELKPEAEIIIIDKEKQANYMPNGLNYLYRKTISDLSQSIWESPILSAQKRIKQIQAEVQEIDSQNKQLKLATPDGERLYQNFDTLVCAMGAKAESTYIKGSKNPKVLTSKYFQDSLEASQKIADCQNIVVIGAGLIGLDLAYSLSLAGKQVTLVEASDHIDFHQTDLDMLEPLVSEIQSSQVTILTQTRIKSIEDNDEGLILITDRGDQLVTDLVLLAINFRPNSELLENQLECLLDKTVKVNDNFQTSNPCIYAIGDLIASSFSPLGIRYYTPLINQAIRSGQALAYHLAGYPTPKLESTKVVGSAHFNYYRSSVGVTEEEGIIYDDLVSILYKTNLQKGIDSPLWIKLIARQKDGRIIGAQFLSKINNLLLANQLAQAISNKLCDSQLAFQDFIFLKGESDSAYHLHQAALSLFEKRNKHED